MTWISLTKFLEMNAFYFALCSSMQQNCTYGWAQENKGDSDFLALRSSNIPQTFGIRQSRLFLQENNSKEPSEGSWPSKYWRVNAQTNHVWTAVARSKRSFIHCISRFGQLPNVFWLSVPLPLIRLLLCSATGSACNHTLPLQPVLWTWSHYLA